jgi:hypothetical protein
MHQGMLPCTHACRQAGRLALKSLSKLGYEGAGMATQAPSGAMQNIKRSRTLPQPANTVRSSASISHSCKQHQGMMMTLKAGNA